MARSPFWSPLLGKTGSLAVSLLTIESLDQAEDYIVGTAMTDLGKHSTMK